MKKLSIVLVTIVLCCSAFLFTGCDQAKTAETQPEEPTLFTVPVGTKLPSYPNTSFDYSIIKYEGDLVFHIEYFSVELASKNLVTPDTNVSGIYDPFDVKIKVKGNTDKSLAGQSFLFNVSRASTGYGVTFTIGENGDFYAEKNYGINTSNIEFFSFTRILYAQ